MTFSAKLVENQIEITYENMDKIIVNFYKTDLEAYYSLNPFSEGNFD